MSASASFARTAASYAFSVGSMSLRPGYETKLIGQRGALVVAERARERGERRLELGGAARADDDRDALVGEQPGQRERGRVAAFFFQAEDGIRGGTVTGVQTCALPI